MRRRAGEGPGGGEAHVEHCRGCEVASVLNEWQMLLLWYPNASMLSSSLGCCYAGCRDPPPSQ